MLLTELDHCYIKVRGLTTKMRHLARQVFRGINVPFCGEHSRNSYSKTAMHLNNAYAAIL